MTFGEKIIRLGFEGDVTILEDTPGESVFFVLPLPFLSTIQGLQYR